MEQSVDSVWMCLVLELGVQAQRCCWLWRCLSPCAVGQSLGVLPASLSDLPTLLLLGDQAARTQQLQAGEGGMRHPSKCTCPKQKAREAERLRRCCSCWLSVGVTLRSGTALRSLLETLW